MTAQEIYDHALWRLRDEAGADAIKALPQARAITLINEAQNEACRRAHLLRDRTTTAICQIAVVAGTYIYALDSRVIKVHNALLVTSKRQLCRTYIADMDCYDYLWETRTGTPDRYVADYQTGKIALYKNPVVSETLKLDVVRLPLTQITALTETPEIPAHLHVKLVPWLLWAVRSLDDTETFDPRKASMSMDEFESEFGPKRSAWAEKYEETQPYPEDE